MKRYLGKTVAAAAATSMLLLSTGVTLMASAPAHALEEWDNEDPGGGGGGGQIDDQVVEIVGDRIYPEPDEEPTPIPSAYDELILVGPPSTPWSDVVPVDGAEPQTRAETSRSCSYTVPGGANPQVVIYEVALPATTTSPASWRYFMYAGSQANEISQAWFVQLWSRYCTTSK
jgi:hypothetical protein